MSYADGQYPTCQHEKHVTRDDLERWWLSVGGKPSHALPQPAAAGLEVPATVPVGMYLEAVYAADWYRHEEGTAWRDS